MKRPPLKVKSQTHISQLSPCSVIMAQPTVAVFAAQQWLHVRLKEGADYPAWYLSIGYMHIYINLKPFAIVLYMSLSRDKMATTLIGVFIKFGNV